MSDPEVSLTGVWDGRFSYPRGFKPVLFTATVLHFGSTITGAIYETPPEGRSAGKRLYATLEGQVDGSDVMFAKLYDDGIPHGRPLLYRGNLSSDGLEIEGTWMLPGSWSGKFLMVRSGNSIQSATMRKREKLPADV